MTSKGIAWLAAGPTHPVVKDNFILNLESSATIGGRVAGAFTIVQETHQGTGLRWGDEFPKPPELGLRLMGMVRWPIRRDLIVRRIPGIKRPWTG